MPEIKLDIECKSCNGTGLYSGMAERDGAAVVCSSCDGTGCMKYNFVYKEFTKRKDSKNVKRVYQINPGVVIGEGCVNGENIGLEDFGGISYNEWSSGQGFGANTEMRKFVCPLWWYQSADYDRKPNWKECGFGVFKSCKHFEDKDKCWEKFDKEHGEK